VSGGCLAPFADVLGTGHFVLWILELKVTKRGFLAFYFIILSQSNIKLNSLGQWQ
jgi:hypothetical protein